MEKNKIRINAADPGLTCTTNTRCRRRRNECSTVVAGRSRITRSRRRRRHQHEYSIGSPNVRRCRQQYHTPQRRRQQPCPGVVGAVRQSAFEREWAVGQSCERSCEKPTRGGHSPVFCSAPSETGPAGRKTRTSVARRHTIAPPVALLVDRHLKVREGEEESRRWRGNCRPRRRRRRLSRGRLMMSRLG